jgi:hypothetical protein
MAAQADAGSLSSELFGKGTGAAGAAAARKHGAGPGNPLPDDAAAGGYSDFGTILVERGWVGVAVSGLVALALAIASIRLVRRLPEGKWPAAFALAVPGAIAVVVIYGLAGGFLQNHACSASFWIVAGVGLSGWFSFIGRNA